MTTIALEALEIWAILFGLTYALATFVLLGLSLREMAWYARGQQPTRVRPESLAHTPTLSLVVPAHNEEPLIVDNVSSFLKLDYPDLEVVVVDDGSSDGTLERLQEAFELVPLPMRGRIELETARFKALLISRSQPRLRVLAKENGGRSDALNAGICVARGELVAMVDADSFLEPDALDRAVRPYEIYPETCVAVGGAIRIANGSTIESGRVVASHVATRGVVATQTLEYLRGFLSSRIAWSRLNGLLIISGAFGVYRRDLLIALGGLSKHTLGEDMELTMRFHHQLRPSWKGAAVFYAPDAVCWTECPNALRALRTQRIRWHVGLLDNLRIHRAMCARPRFGAAGTLAYPYVVLYEMLAPLLHMIGYTVGLILIIIQPTNWRYLATFLIVTIFLGQVLNATALLIAEIGFHRYSPTDMLRLAAWGLIEAIWYQPTQAWWRTKATLLALSGHRPGWGTIPRGVSIHETPANAAAPLTR
jgi:cellulose synthase/poly-beta-1,6-N-acetylglucosamine synthase-like glycosyltransferase